jgi:hypothetical protein
MREVIIGTTLALIAASASADGVGRATAVEINCDPLIPARQPTTEVETRAKAGVEALLKRIPILSGEASGNVRITREDLLKGVPNSDRVIESQLRAYLICQAIKQRPDRSLELAQLFVGQVLPAANQNAQAAAVLPSEPFPKSGRITIPPSGSAVFDKGTLVIEASPLGDDEVRTFFKLKPGEKLMYTGPLLNVVVVSKPYGAPEIATPAATFKLNDARKYSIGGRRFLLTFKELFDGSGTAEFLVQPIQ